MDWVYELASGKSASDVAAKVYDQQQAETDPMWQYIKQGQQTAAAKAAAIAKAQQAAQQSAAALPGDLPGGIGIGTLLVAGVALYLIFGR